MFDNTPVLLVREPLHPHDPNAIAVLIPQGKIGYVPRDYAAEIAPLLDKGALHRSHVRILVRDNGDREFPSPQVRAWLYPPETRGIDTIQGRSTSGPFTSDSGMDVVLLGADGRVRGRSPFGTLRWIIGWVIILALLVILFRSRS